MNAKGKYPIAESELHEKFIRSSGPGGQNANKVATAVQLRFDAAGSPSLSGRQKTQLARIARHLMTDDGEIVIEASRFRTQMRNRQDARERLAELIELATKPPPKPRKKSKPTKASVERRLFGKARRARTKRLRGQVSADS